MSKGRRPGRRGGYRKGAEDAEEEGGGAPVASGHRSEN